MEIAEAKIGTVREVTGSVSVHVDVVSSVASPDVLTDKTFSAIRSVLDSIGLFCDGVFKIAASVELLSMHLASRTKNTFENSVTDADQMIEVSFGVLESVEDVVEWVDPSS